jgi:ribosomal protein S27AE
VEDYTRQWNVYRRWRNLGFATMAGYLVVMTVVAIKTKTWADNELALAVPFAVFAMLFVWIARKTGTFPCPRCGKQFLAPFGERFGVTWKGGDKCVHCGLAKYADG